MSSSSGPEPSPAAARGRWHRSIAVLVVGLVAGLLAVVAPVGTLPAAAATGGCRAVSGAPAAAGGPQRATVVVDTGSGAVWSACVSFRGEVSGIEALELAKAQIPGLSPVYDLYAGEGRAVCRLRGVGNDPPDCLGKSVEYWGYFRNGRYSSAGAGAVRVRDGDVEAWRWGASGATPRRASDGYEAAPYVAPPPTTAPPTTRVPVNPAPPVTSPPSGGSPATISPGPGSTVAPGAAGASSTTTAVGSPDASTTSTTAVACSTSSTSSTSVAPDDDPDAASPASGSSGDDELAAAAPGSPGGPSLDEGDDGSSAASIAAFAAALAALGGAGLLVRRRRSAAA